MKALRTALVAIRRSPYQSLISIFILTITFFVAYAFSLLSIGSQRILSFFETQPQVIAFLKLEAKQEDLQAIADKIKGKDYVAKVTLVDQEEALRMYQADNQNDPLLLELVTAEILPSSVEVAAYDAKNLDLIKQDLAQEAMVEEVVLQEDVIGNLVRWTNALRIMGLFLLSTLSLVSFLMIMNTISMHIAAKRKNMQIMKFIGASNAYVSRPFLLEATITGLLSNSLAFAVYYGVLLYISPWLTDFLDGIISWPPTWQFFVYQFAAGLLVAFLIGMFASAVALRRMLKKN